MKIQFRALVLTGALLLVAALALIPLVAQGPTATTNEATSWTPPRTNRFTS